MNIQLIWAQDTNAAIGKDGTLPWDFSEDLKNFKKLTTGHIIIMGRKTWDSLPIKPLPNRKNIVISSTKQTGVDSYNSIDACMEYLLNNQSLQNIFVIGGMSIYKHFYDHADTLYITFIDKSFDATDTFFPISLTQIKNDFKCIENRDSGDLQFTKWIRK